jgi:hypothetical protein
MSKGIIWFSYILGAILTLGFKYAKYLYDGNKTGTTSAGHPWEWKDATVEWFFEGSIANGVSWVTTIGVVWVFGSAYITRIEWLFGDYLQSIPLDYGIAFLLGSLMELIAPAAVKWIVSKFPFGD